MTLEILTPSGTTAHAEDVSAVFLPGLLGEFEVLRHHAPIISALGRGAIRWRGAGGGEESVAVESGFVIVENDHIQACVEQ